MRGHAIAAAFVLSTAVLGALQSTVPSTTSTPGTASPAAVPSATVTQNERPSFTEWLAGVRAEALTRGIRPEIADAALANVSEPLPVVIDRDRAQAEAVLSIESYLNRQVTLSRIRTGREMLTKHKVLLDQITAKYGVPARIVLSIWGLETNYGRFLGIRPTVAALATLAWDPRRSAFFRGELFNALEILNRGDIDLSKMRGSWAGAMGQPQFMPSSYLAYAEDFDGDGQRNIWDSEADIFASIANYLKGYGWTEGQLWGREVKITPAGFTAIASSVAHQTGGCQATRDMTVRLPLSEWTKRGVMTMSGGKLPAVDLEAALVSGKTRRFLVYGNYNTILSYNCSNSYALSVALLADRIAQ